MSPLWLWADNQLAAWAERSGSYAFYSVDVWLKSLGTLTVAAVTEHDFSVSVIPHTAAVTILGKKGPGDKVNLETDIIGKYVEKLLCHDGVPSEKKDLTMEFLAQNGF